MWEDFADYTPRANVRIIRVFLAENIFKPALINQF
jgi:hypothetical protein